MRVGQTTVKSQTAFADFVGFADTGLSALSVFGGAEYMDQFGQGADGVAAFVHGVAGFGFGCNAVATAGRNNANTIPKLMTLGSEWTKTAGYILQATGSPLLGAGITLAGTVGTITAGILSE